MENAQQRPQGTEPPGDRLTRLSAASLRINESLDVYAALQAVMDGARSLTDSPYASIVTLDGAGRVDDHDRLLRRVWSPGEPGNLRALRTHLMHLRRKRGEDGENSRYILVEPRLGCWMPEWEWSE